VQNRLFLGLSIVKLVKDSGVYQVWKSRLLGINSSDLCSTIASSLLKEQQQTIANCCCSINRWITLLLEIKENKIHK
jgi:hypothetical protein